MHDVRFEFYYGHRINCDCVDQVQKIITDMDNSVEPEIYLSRLLIFGSEYLAEHLERVVTSIKYTFFF